MKLVTSDPKKEYTFKYQIGRGAWSEVFKVVYIKTGEKFAVKIMTPRNTTEKSLFLNEIIITSLCRHPNIITFYKTYDYKGKFYVVEELMNSHLYKILKPGESLPENIINYVLVEILKALEYLHKKHRVHRDIKSDNILINARGDVKLADLGFAVQLTEERPNRYTLAGTPCWIAPEILNHEAYNGAVDIWSIGVLLIEMLEGVPPNLRENKRQIFSNILTDGVHLSRPELVRNEYISILNDCLQYNPNLRKTASELLQQEFLRVTATKEEAAKYFTSGIDLKFDRATARDH